MIAELKRKRDERKRILGAFLVIAVILIALLSNAHRISPGGNATQKPETPVRELKGPLSAPADDIKTETSSMSFEACLAVIAKTATKLGTAPVNIAETTAMRIVRFPGSDGSVLITCSRDDQKMVVTRSPKRCGVEVNCYWLTHLGVSSGHRL